MKSGVSQVEKEEEEEETTFQLLSQVGAVCARRGQKLVVRGETEEKRQAKGRHVHIQRHGGARQGERLW